MQILYGFARDENGRLINAEDAEKSRKFFCGFCKQPFVLRKSGKAGPRTKRPHFAHKALTSNCSPESALHFEFKNLLFQRIQDALRDEIDFPLSWECRYCRKIHSGHLLKNARKAAMEYNLASCRPDIVLFDDKERVVAAIEVVFTHAPEETVVEFYRLNKIVLVECKLLSDSDLIDVTAKLTRDVYIHLCPDRTRCRICGEFQHPVSMKIIEAKCYRCKSKIKVPFIEDDPRRGSSHLGPEHFTSMELRLARENGAIIEWQYSRTLNTKYWAATCGRCKAFVGSHYLYDEYIVPAHYEGWPTLEIPLRPYCMQCDPMNLLPPGEDIYRRR